MPGPTYQTRGPLAPYRDHHHCRQCGEPHAPLPLPVKVSSRPHHARCVEAGWPITRPAGAPYVVAWVARESCGCQWRRALQGLETDLLVLLPDEPAARALVAARTALRPPTAREPGED